MFQSVLLILLSSCLQCLGLCLLSSTLGKTGEVGSDGDKGRPLICPTTRGECTDQHWQWPSMPAWPCHCLWSGVCTARVKNSRCCQQSAVMEVGKCMDVVFEGTRGSFIGVGLPVQCLPQCGYLHKVFYLCQKKGREACSIILRFHTSFFSLKLLGQWGAALVVLFFHESEVG